ncbi:MAG: biotin--[acetyl-CoA-carboxylase] ligase [Methylocystis sp.]|nr:MAG: biotin--[acetyl-CoA-carboxylase] ligase [Methylocystis sp.]
MQLGRFARARGVRLLSLGEVDSTNSESRRLIDSGERGPLWIVAERQTMGRGRLGRNWMSPPGNLYASFIYGDLHDVRVAPELGFVAGVAAMRALRASAGSQSFKLKWPNDLLLEGAKLGGILLECVGPPAAPVAIIGVGVNVVSAPEGLPYPARALADIGAGAPSASAFFAQLSDSLLEALDIWRSGEGFAGIRTEWSADAAAVGEEVRVALNDETVVGRFDGVDQIGRLVLGTRHGRRVIEAGDVLLGPRATEGARQ